MLESGDDAYLVPAHIWTPWFAMFGSKSGFDTVDECFGDLARHVFAIETGLSSDPAMNWRLSQLDRYRLVSNSDAHSPAKLGREATRFTGALDYFALRRALETGEGFGGTVEFFPEEGKYHLDGHRKCGVRLTPPESRAHGGRCPDCAGPLTIGTMNRVDELADRPDGFTPEGHDPFASFIPLPELIGEIEGVGPGSKQVARVYERVIDGVGPELFILDEAPLEELRTHGSELLAEAVARMRAGDVIRDPGYDGEYGTIRVFEPRELARRTCVGTLFDAEVMGEGATPDAPRPASADAADRDLEPSARAGGATSAAGVRQASHEASSTGQVVTAGAGGPHTGERERSATAAAADREAASVAGTSAARDADARHTSHKTSPMGQAMTTGAGGPQTAGEGSATAADREVDGVSAARDVEVRQTSHEASPTGQVEEDAGALQPAGEGSVSAAAGRDLEPLSPVDGASAARDAEARQTSHEGGPMGPIVTGARALQTAGEREESVSAAASREAASVDATTATRGADARGMNSETCSMRQAEEAADTLAGLDPDQRAAAAIAAGALLIVAGPGTGKTRTLTHRIAHLVRDHGVPPGACLAITFTRRAAEELRERLGGLLGAAGEEVVVRTFHGFGHELLRAHAAALELDDGFRIAHEWEQEEVLIEALDIDARAARRLLKELSQAGRSGAALASGSELEQAARAYRRGLRARGLVDCDELVSLAVSLLERDDDVRASLQRRFTHVSVDEYQDVDELQYRLIRLLVPTGGNLCAIGDPDQAIYSFRGADVGYFLRFVSDYPGARQAALTRNYRSGRRIVDASMQVIARGTLTAGRVLEAQRSDALALIVHEAASAAAEAEFVVHSVERMIGGYSFFSVDSGRVDAGDASEYSFGDFAILYRSAALLPPLLEALRRSGIPFERRSHGRLDDDPGVRAIVKELSKETCTLTPAELLAVTLAADPGLEPSVALLRPLLARSPERAAFLDEIAAGAQCDTWDPRADRLSLMTLHAAKGLEFPVVFLVGCEDGVIPLRFAPDDDIAEERRLFFVGMTRAQRRLFLTRARKRAWRGAVREQAISPFVLDIREQLLEREASTHKARPRPVDPQLLLF
ncbi:MAG: UvrD-helicase domain-containing protein [Myxococcales bacterium]|nr:UvrD-helicase domain-containing protein [Myxococcales bacterium]